MQLLLTNSLTKQKELFHPLDVQNIRIYVCGPTVYDRPHLGNARSAVVYDVLFRVLNVLYPKVTYVRNITDVDDKIIDAVINSKEDIRSLTQRVTQDYHADMEELNCLNPTVEPRATAHIPYMIKMIESLIVGGYAYVVENHVLFSIESYNQYGKLANRSVEEMIAGARVEVAPFKKHPADFILWKPAKEHEIPYSFMSPWGLGRPGWHIECSAMSLEHLGDTFDIHGGGADLMFPHHENEMAQSKCAIPGAGFAKYWVHNGFLTVNGDKMSKSLGNFKTVRELIEQGICGTAIRYFYLTSHYRKPLDFNDKAIADAEKAIAKLYDLLQHGFATIPNSQGNKQCNQDIYLSEMESWQERGAKCSLSYMSDEQQTKYSFIRGILTILADDLNTPNALAYLHSLMTKITISAFEPELFYELLFACNILGLIPIRKKFQQDIPNKIRELAELRLEARKQCNWVEADRLRAILAESGYEVTDGKDYSYTLKHI